MKQKLFKFSITADGSINIKLFKLALHFHGVQDKYSPHGSIYLLFSDWLLAKIEPMVDDFYFSDWFCKWHGFGGFTIQLGLFNVTSLPPNSFLPFGKTLISWANWFFVEINPSK